jgi:glutathione S-transferase
MADNTLSIPKPSVNNSQPGCRPGCGARLRRDRYVGQQGTPDFLKKAPADLTPLLEEEGLPKGSLWESCAIMQYLCNKHGLDRLYPTDPAERTMTDSAMFYLVGTQSRSRTCAGSWPRSSSGRPEAARSATGLPRSHSA